MTFSRFNRRALAFGHDTIMAALAFVLALYLRMGSDWSPLPASDIAVSLLMFTATCAAVFWVAGLYRSIWAFASVRDLMEIFRAVTIAVASFVLLAFVTTRL